MAVGILTFTFAKQGDELKIESQAREICDHGAARDLSTASFLIGQRGTITCPMENKRLYQNLQTLTKLYILQPRTVL
jgi:hypothetical protein